MVTEASNKRNLEGDVVELLMDFPDTDLQKGQRGVIVTAFDEPQEAYDIAVEDEQGNLVGFAYSAKPNQFVNLVRQDMEEGIRLFEEMKTAEAAQVFRRVFELRPSLIGNLLNAIINNFEYVESWPVKIHLLRFVSRLNPDYQVAKTNLAVAYLNWGAQLARENPSSEQAVRLFQTALTIETEPDVITQLHKNLAASFTAWGITASEQGKCEEALNAMKIAGSYFPSESTRHNFAIAAVRLAFEFMQNKKYDAAAIAFEQAEDAGLVHHESLNDYGVALVHIGRSDDAARAFEKALELSPDNPVIISNLLRLYHKQVAEEFLPEGLGFEHTMIPLSVETFELATA